MFKKPLIILLLLGLFLRLILSIQIYSGDVNNHISWGKDSLKRGFSGIYERDFWPGYGTMTPTYPPIPIFLFVVFDALFDWSYKTSWDLNLKFPFFPSNLIYFFEDQDTLPAFLKIPAIFADLGIAYVVYLFVSVMAGPAAGFPPASARVALRRPARVSGSLPPASPASIVPGHPFLPVIAASLVLFNPAFFYNSAYWGQIEAIPLFFALSAFYLLLYSRRFVLASVVFTLALLAKQSSIVFIPVFGLVFLMRFGFVKTFKAIGGSILVFWLSFLPFYKTGNILLFPFITYWNKIQTGSGSDYIVDHAFNFWVLVKGLSKIPDSSLFIFGMSFKLWGYLIFGLILLVVLWGIYRREKDVVNILLGNFLVAGGAFLFLTRMHERYLEPALPFFLLTALFSNKKMFVGFLFLSLFYFSNLYHNWWAPRVDWVVDLLSLKYVLDIMILLVLGLFLSSLLKYIKGEKLEKNN